MLRWRVTIVALIPVIALTIAVPFVNRMEPSVWGFPFVFVWIVVWVLLTPAFLWYVGRLERRW
jgi:hypothetical protein